MRTIERRRIRGAGEDGVAARRPRSASSAASFDVAAQSSAGGLGRARRSGTRAPLRLPAWLGRHVLDRAAASRQHAEQERRIGRHRGCTLMSNARSLPASAAVEHGAGVHAASRRVNSTDWRRPRPRATAAVPARGTSSPQRARRRRRRASAFRIAPTAVASYGGGYHAGSSISLAIATDQRGQVVASTTTDEPPVPIEEPTVPCAPSRT